GRALDELEVEARARGPRLREAPPPLGAKADEVRLRLRARRDAAEVARATADVVPVPRRDVHLGAVGELLVVRDVEAREVETARLGHAARGIVARLRPRLATAGEETAELDPLVRTELVANAALTVVVLREREEGLK